MGHLGDEFSAASRSPRIVRSPDIVQSKGMSREHKELAERNETNAAETCAGTVRRRWGNLQKAVVVRRGIVRDHVGWADG